MKDLEENDEETTTLADLTEKMHQILGSSADAYSFTYMKQRILDKFGGKVMIAEVIGKEDVVTFRSTASQILHNYSHQQKQENSEAEKMRLIDAAAKLVKNDIKNITQSSQNYPSVDSMTIEDCTSFIPESLKNIS